MPAFSGLFGAGWAINSSEYFEIPLPTLKSTEILREVAVSRAELEIQEKPSPWEGSLGLVPDHGQGGASVSRGAVMLRPPSADSELAGSQAGVAPPFAFGEHRTRASSLTSAAPLGQGQPPELWRGGVGGHQGDA